MVGNTHGVNSNLVYDLGAGTEFDVTNIPGYKNLTVDNFIIVVSNISVSTDVAGNKGWGNSAGNIVPAKSYDATTGKLVLSDLTAKATTQKRCNFSYNNQLSSDHTITSSGTATLNCKVYCIIGNIKQIM